MALKVKCAKLSAKFGDDDSRLIGALQWLLRQICNITYIWEAVFNYIPCSISKQTYAPVSSQFTLGLDHVRVWFSLLWRDSMLVEQVVDTAVNPPSKSRSRFDPQKLKIDLRVSKDGISEKLYFFVCLLSCSSFWSNGMPPKKKVLTLCPGIIVQSNVFDKGFFHTLSSFDILTYLKKKMEQCFVSKTEKQSRLPGTQWWFSKKEWLFELF